MRGGGTGTREVVAGLAPAAAGPDFAVTVTGTGGLDEGGGAANTVLVSDFDQNFLKIPSMNHLTAFSFFIASVTGLHKKSSAMPGAERIPPPLSSATLYVVATPIGNLDDITSRALRTLRDCDVVAAEDTRRTGQLLHYFGISRPILSYFRFNEAKRSEEILERLRRGEKVALVTDAGTPGISDPGERVVRAAVGAGFRVESVPGPCALVAALTASGLPTGEFHFIGFLPVKAGQRRKRLEGLRSVPGTLIFYESPYRVEKLVAELAELYPDCMVVLARELTKKFEEYLRGRPADLVARLKMRSIKGEFVVLVSRAGEHLDSGNEDRPATDEAEAPGE
jgi:16S rRNA (cytidine1402-2'-O)-methyltransferase